MLYHHQDVKVLVHLRMTDVQKEVKKTFRNKRK